MTGIAVLGRRHTAPATAGGGFATPDQINEASFETGFDSFNDGGAGSPTGVTRDNTLAAPGGGSWSLKETWTPQPSTEQGCQCYRDFADLDELWLRAYIRVTAQIDTTQKFLRFFNPGQSLNFGGFFLVDDKLRFFTDRENATAQHGETIVTPTIVDSQWHCVEMHYRRNGDPSGWPMAEFWTDNVLFTHADGTLDSFFGGGSPPGNGYWLNNKLYQGERSTSVKINQLGVMLTLNAGVTTSGQANVDRICVSSLGRVGP